MDHSHHQEVEYPIHSSRRGVRLPGGAKEETSLFGGKWLHVLYWVIIAWLAWSVVALWRQEERLEAQVVDAETRQAATGKQLGTLSQQVKEMKGSVAANEARLEKSLQRNEIKAKYMQQLSMEQHYLAKVENMRRLSKNQHFFKENEKARVSYLLALNNYRLVHQNIHIKREIDELLKTEYERLSKLHDFSLPEKSFCIFVATVNNGKDFRYAYNLRSIMNQNYTNYKIVIIDDASTDLNADLIQQFLDENPIPQKVTLVRNPVRLAATANIYKAATEYCDSDDIFAMVDGDDELLGVNVLKVFNSVYTLKNLDVLYSNIIVNEKNQYIKRGWSSAYSDEEKRLNKYRDKDTRMFPLRSFKVSTFLKINPSDLKDREGRFYLSASDQTICPMVLELSCGRNEYIDEFFYLYNYGLGNNDMEIDKNLNWSIMNEVLQRKKRYTCLPNK